LQVRSTKSNEFRSKGYLLLAIRGKLFTLQNLSNLISILETPSNDHKTPTAAKRTTARSVEASTAEAKRCARGARVFEIPTLIGHGNNPAFIGFNQTTVIALANGCSSSLSCEPNILDRSTVFATCRSPSRSGFDGGACCNISSKITTVKHSCFVRF
jgi:hypothetical protein